MIPACDSSQVRIIFDRVSFRPNGMIFISFFYVLYFTLILCCFVTVAVVALRIHVIELIREHFDCLIA